MMPNTIVANANARALIAERLRRIALALVAALLVARPLVVSESAADGGGLWFVQLWLGAAVLWALWQVTQGRLLWRFHSCDLAVLILVIMVVASSFNAASRRPAINLAWEWVALGLIYVLVRQLPQTAGEYASLATVVLALAVALAGYGIYEYFRGQAALREEFLRNREASLRELGIEPGTADARRFEDRLLFTHEPLVTFASTNSLAGFVLPWLLVTVAWATSVPWRRPGVALCALILGTALLLLAMCLFLTKSRSAWGGAAIGILLWVFLARPVLGRQQRIAMLAGAAVLTIAATLIVFFGRGFDQFLVTKVRDALAYRTQYWIGTWGVIREHFWLGVGPGNFQQHYPAHKLAASSEEIADAHNLFLELWSTSGVFAAAALVVVLFLFASAVWGKTRQLISAERIDARGPRSKDRLLEAPFLVAGAGGFFAVMGMSSLLLLPGTANPTVLFALFAVWAPAFFLLAVALRGAALTRGLIAIAATALVVHLLAAGGIGFPSVAQNLWLLIALGLNITQVRPARVIGATAVSLSAAVLTAVLFAAALLTATRPVAASNAAMAEARAQLRSGFFNAAMMYLREASRHDPLAKEPIQTMAELRFARWRQLRAQHSTSPDPALGEKAEEQFRAAVRLAARVISLDPHRPSLRWRLARYWLAHYVETRERSSAEAAVKAMQDCVTLYPTNAAYLAAFGEALRLAGRDAQGTGRVEQALALLHRTPHEDKRIEVLEVLEASSQRHPNSALRRAELARALWHDANWVYKDPRQKRSRRAKARQAAQTALRLDSAAPPAERLSPQWRKLLRQQVEETNRD